MWSSVRPYSPLFCHCWLIRSIGSSAGGSSGKGRRYDETIDVPPTNRLPSKPGAGVEHGNEQKSRSQIRQWRRREEFNRHLRAEAGLDEAGEKFDRQAPPDSRIAQDFLSKEIRRKRGIVIREMAQRKYYNTPVEENLLTWKAKEQIFHLREQDREKWTPETIADSFPVSVEGARRLLKSKFPPAPTGEAEDVVIRRHDQEVAQRWKLIKKGKSMEGVLSEHTLDMIRSGKVKFLPMFESGDFTPAKNEETSEEFSSTITPDDGPFMKLYKNHLQYLEKSSNVTRNSDFSDDGNKHQSIIAQSDIDQELRPFVFPDDESDTGNGPVQFEQFRQQLQEALKRRNRPEDKKYKEWMDKNTSQEKDHNEQRGHRTT